MLRLLVLLLLVVPRPALAWWEYGHETVARVALANVKPATRARIASLLRAEPALATSECRVRSLADAAVWPDCVKSLKDAAGKSRFGYAYNWHFQSVDICRPFDPAAACKDGDCVTAQIPRQAALLADRHLPRGDRLRALAFLAHFVGDIHQPLHVGQHDDLGGNKVAASYGGVGGRVNLHAVWDGYLAERAISTPPGERRLERRVSLRERRLTGRGSAIDWARETWGISRTIAYPVALDTDPCAGPVGRAGFDEAKIARLTPIVRRQIRRAGLRLARLLDRALG